MAKKRLLIAFDFDHTLVDENTDISVINLAPEEELPQEIQNLYTVNGWIPYMGEVFKYLHKNGTSKDDILECISKIPLTEGMRELLEYKNKDIVDIDYIIISDSNSVFIQHVLDGENLSHLILKVFTNPAHFDSQDCLKVTGYQSQDWCTLSSENMCKSHILENFLKERKASSVEYSNVIYVGDGSNDLCPGLILRQEDFLMPRIGFKLQSLIQKVNEKDQPVKKSEIKPGVVPWSSGFDILKLVESLVK